MESVKCNTFAATFVNAPWNMYNLTGYNADD